MLLIGAGALSPDGRLTSLDARLTHAAGTPAVAADAPVRRPGPLYDAMVR